MPGKRVAIAAFWALLIFCFDRAIATTVNFGGFWRGLGIYLPRILVALTTAILVSEPITLLIFDKEITKPVVMASRLHDRDFLAQLEAVDRFMASMHAYPGRTFGQLYHQFFRVNDLADGHLRLSDHDIDLEDVRVPVLCVAGESDVLAPQAAVHHLGGLLPNAPVVRMETGPGGHLGVLTGRGAKRTTWRWLDEFLRGTEAEAAVAQPVAA